MSSPFVLGKLADTHGLNLKPLEASDFHGTPGARARSHLNALSTGAMSGFQKAMAGTAGAGKPLSERDHILHSSTAIQGPHEKLVHETQRWVAQTFYGTMMKQMHDTPFKAPWVDGGRGGQAFQPLLDQHMIDHIAKSSSKKLVNSIVKKIEGKRKYAQQRVGGLNNATLSQENPAMPTAAENYVSANLRA